MDIQSIIHKMTLEQKISLCTGADSWHTTAIEELAVPSLTMSDGTNGVRFQKPRRLTAPCNLYDATVAVTGPLGKNKVVVIIKEHTNNNVGVDGVLKSDM